MENITCITQFERKDDNTCGLERQRTQLGIYQHILHQGTYLNCAIEVIV